MMELASEIEGRTANCCCCVEDNLDGSGQRPRLNERAESASGSDWPDGLRLELCRAELSKPALPLTSSINRQRTDCRGALSHGSADGYDGRGHGKLRLRSSGVVIWACLSKLYEVEDALRLC